MLISAFLNVRLWTLQTPINYTANGGYFSWPLIWLLEKGLKYAIVIVLLLGAIVYLLYILNVRLPKLPKINIEQSEKPIKKEKKTDSKEDERPTITISRPDISTDDILEKVSQATGKVVQATSS